MIRNGRKAQPAQPPALRPDHQEVFDALMLALLGRKRFLFLLGGDRRDRALLFSRVTSYLAADGALVLPVGARPQMQVEDLMSGAGTAALGSLPDDFDTLIEELESRLDMAGTGLLAIDDAHVLSPAVLADLADLTRSETEQGRFVQVLLCGAPELERHLARPDLGAAIRDLGAVFALSGSAPEAADVVEERPVATPPPLVVRTVTDWAPPRRQAMAGAWITGVVLVAALGIAVTLALPPGQTDALASSARGALERTRSFTAQTWEQVQGLSGQAWAGARDAWHGVSSGVASLAGREPDRADAVSLARPDSRPEPPRVLLTMPPIEQPPPVEPPLPAKTPPAAAAETPAKAEPPPPPPPAPPPAVVLPPLPSAPPLPTPPVVAQVPVDPIPPAAEAPPEPEAEPAPPPMEAAMLAPPPPPPPAMAQPAPQPDTTAQRVRALVEQARRQMAGKRLTTPPGDNALETVQRIRELTPQAPEITQLVAAMVDTYRRWAAMAEREGSWGDARSFYERALLVAPDDADLRARLKDAEERSRRADDVPAPKEPDLPGHTATVAGFGGLADTLALFQAPDRLDATLAAGANPNHRFEDGKTVLMHASEQGLGASVRRLLAAGANPNPRSRDGATALMYASYNGHGDVVAMLADAGADINAANTDGKTALMAAAARGHAPVVRALLARGAVVDHATAQGWTALMYAANAGQERVARLLVEHGADPLRTDTEGRSALAMGRQRGSMQMVQTLTRR